MANTRDSGVIYTDADGATSYAFPMSICGIKYIGNTSGTCDITNRNSTKTLWEEAGTANVFNEVEIQAMEGITVTLSNGAAVYIYLNA